MYLPKTVGGPIASEVCPADLSVTHANARTTTSLSSPEADGYSLRVTAVYGMLLFMESYNSSNDF